MRQGAGVQHERRWLPAAMAVLWACGLVCAPGVCSHAGVATDREALLADGRVGRARHAGLH